MSKLAEILANGHPAPTPLPIDFRLGLALLRETIEKTHKLQRASWGFKYKIGPGAVALMLDGIETRLEVAKSMLLGDGEWRKQTRWPIVLKMLKREEEWQAAAGSLTEGYRRPQKGFGGAESHNPTPRDGEGPSRGPHGVQRAIPANGGEDFEKQDKGEEMETTTITPPPPPLPSSSSTRCSWRRRTRW